MLQSNLIDLKLFRTIVPTNPKAGHIYFLPKIHKQIFPVPGRPIISGSNMATEKLSAYVDFQLTPFMNRDFIPSYIRDTTDFLNCIKDITNLPPTTLLVTMDVSSLYTNIPHKDGIEAVEHMLNLGKLNSNLICYLKKSIECILTNNNFTFSDKHYLQLTGTAMGTRMAPKYANIFMANFEKQLLSISQNKPLHYFRFIDDIFMIWTSGLDNLKTFIESANNLHPSINFTYEYSTTNIAFLDTKIHISNNKIETEIYTKPTDSHQYLLPSSCHPRHVVKNLPYSLALRIKRICSTEPFFQKHIQQLKQQLLQRNYRESDIQMCINRLENTTREQLLKGPSNHNITKPSRTPFVTPFHPNLPNIKSILTKFDHILKHNRKSDSLKNIKPLIAYRKCKTLKDILFRPKLTSIPTDNDILNNSPGFHHCGRVNCTTCKHSKNNTTKFISFNNNNFKIRQVINCHTTNVVYLLSCSYCRKQYVGETGRKLKKRFTEHLRDVRIKADTVVAEHFNLPNHNSSHMEIIGIDKLHNSLEYRRNKEKYWIRTLNTNQPYGLNKKE